MEDVEQNVTLIDILKKGSHYTIFLHEVPRNATEGTYAKVGGAGGAMEGKGTKN
jgi:hypothetical protein